MEQKHLFCHHCRQPFTRKGRVFVDAVGRFDPESRHLSLDNLNMAHYSCLAYYVPEETLLTEDFINVTGEADTNSATASQQQFLNVF